MYPRRKAGENKAHIMPSEETQMVFIRESFNLFERAVETVTPQIDARTHWNCKEANNTPRQGH